jgi:protoheme IX farnesyltransferase|tara:strand:- start:2433 stop:3251 length:819 start_codon:yes stop_codon:yes gene_type:complete
MVLVTTILGFYLGGNVISSFRLLVVTLLGTGLCAGGAGALNHYLERDADMQMERTKNRPLPSGIIQPSQALIFGIILVLLGCTLLSWKVNLLTGFLSLLTAFLYVLVYTPLKKITWLNTTIGSIPGAIPPMGGWTAATGSLDVEAWLLFAILFFWQHPHFFAIAWVCRDDYEKAGFKMLPVMEKDGTRTIRQIFWHLTLLIPVSMLFYINGNSGWIYAIGVFILSLIFAGSAVPLVFNRTNKNALLILKASVMYLPALLILIIIDKVYYFGF